MFEVDWSGAPEWANWHVFNEDGSGWFYEHKPSLHDTDWRCGAPGTRARMSLRSSPGHLPFDWRGTAVERPSPLITQPKKHPHYHKPTNGAETIDVYWVLNNWGVECHAVGHAVKKLLNAGQRGAKTKGQDLQEAIDSIQRAIELEKNQ